MTIDELAEKAWQETWKAFQTVGIDASHRPIAEAVFIAAFKVATERAAVIAEGWCVVGPSPIHYMHAIGFNDACAKIAANIRNPSKELQSTLQRA